MQQINLVLVVFPALAVIFLLFAWRSKSKQQVIQKRTYMRLGFIFTALSLVIIAQRYVF